MSVSVSSSVRLSNLDILRKYCELGLSFVPFAGVVTDYPSEGDLFCTCQLDRKERTGRLVGDCDDPGRHPLRKWKDEIEGPTTLEQIERWYYDSYLCRLSPGNCNWALVPGECDPQLIVLEIDPRNGGAESMAMLGRRHGPLPPTWRDTRRGGGGHYYFRRPDNLADTVSIELAPGVEIIQGRHTIHVPPSTHKTGVPYEFVGAPWWETELLNAPAWIADEIGYKRVRPAPAVMPLDIDVSADERVRRACAYLARVPGAVSGYGGHKATFKVACKLVEFGLDDRAAFALLSEWNERCEPPWTERELTHKLEDARKVATPGAMLAKHEDNSSRWTPPSSASSTPTTHSDVIATAGDDGASEPAPPTPCGKVIAGKTCAPGRLCLECNAKAMAFYGVTWADLDKSKHEAEEFRLDTIEEIFQAEANLHEINLKWGWSDENLEYFDTVNPFTLDRAADCGCKSARFRKPNADGGTTLRYMPTRCKRPSCPRCGAILKHQAKQVADAGILTSVGRGDTILKWDLPAGTKWATFGKCLSRHGAKDYVRVKHEDGTETVLAGVHEPDTKLLTPKSGPAPVVIGDPAEACKAAFKAIDARDMGGRAVSFGKDWKAIKPTPKDGYGERCGVTSTTLARMARHLAAGGLLPEGEVPSEESPWLMYGLRIELPPGVLASNVMRWLDADMAPPSGDWSAPIPVDTDDLGDDKPSPVMAALGFDPAEHAAAMAALLGEELLTELT